MKKKELLNEIMGVPKAIDFWVDIFSIIITGVIKSVVDNDEIEVSDVNYEDDDGNEVEDTAYRGRTMMDGKEVMNWVMKIAGYSDIKNLLQDPKFKLLPIENFKKYNKFEDFYFYFKDKKNDDWKELFMIVDDYNYNIIVNSSMKGGKYKIDEGKILNDINHLNKYKNIFTIRLNLCTLLSIFGCLTLIATYLFNFKLYNLYTCPILPDPIGTISESNV